MRTKEPALGKPAGRQSGFTLLELLAVVAIVGLLAFIGYPTYQDQVRKSRRSEAKAALTETAARMEKYYQNNKTYSITGGDMTKLGYSSSPHTTEHGYYQISIVTASTSATAFLLQAAAQGVQTGDTNCATLTYSSTGVKASKNTGGTATTGCW